MAMTQTEREALVALYNATDGPNWKKNVNWNTDVDLSQWHGITTDDQGRVVRIRLQDHNLQGPIPEELGKLTALQFLNLNSNNLSGTIPKELGALSALRELRLHGNQLSGLWDTLGQDEAGSLATRPGTLPVALASLLDTFDRVGYGLGLGGNPWEHPPEAIVKGGVPAVRDYFEAIYRGGTMAVTRPLKVVILGKETVGKTSLRRSIKAGKPCKTKEGGVESTVHVDVEDHEVDGQPIRIFDCAGQVVYYGLLQLFLTPRAVYLLVWDAGNASKLVWDTKNSIKNMESLAIAPWLRHLTFRVPDANVVLVGNKWDLVASSHSVASEIESQSRAWLDAWMKKAQERQPRGLSLEDGVSLVSCTRPLLAVRAPSFGGGTGWLCDKNNPGLFRRITHNTVGDRRALTMSLPRSYDLALQVLEKLASCSRHQGEQITPGITREGLEEKWQAEVDKLETAGTPVEAPEAAMAGAILIRKWEGGLVEYGNYIFLDIQWFATVLDPLFSHKRDLFGDLDLGGRGVKNASSESLDRLVEDNILEVQLAQELWGAELAPHLLLALKSAGLTFPLPKDPKGGLVILLRMGTEPPDEYSRKLRSQLEQADAAGKHDLRLHVECSFTLGLPPGFVERLLARCCHLGLPYPFWRYGALIVGKGHEEGRFSLTLEYSERNNILTVEVYGGCTEVYAWAALSSVLSVAIKMLAEFPGLPCKLTFLCPRHKDKGMPIRTTNAPPGSPLVESRFCPLCTDQEAGKDLLAVALQVVEFSDDEFFGAQLCKQFAENAQNAALGGRALWPGSNFEVSCQTSPRSQAIQPSSQVSRTPWYQDLRTWVGAASVACLTIFGVLAGKEDDDARVWGVFLGLAIMLLVVEFVLIAKVNGKCCFRVGGASAGNEPTGEARV
eukprot:g8765.t1